MIRILLDRAFDNERHYIHAVGLSTDAKPTTGIITGSKFVAVDTGAGYLFDETAGEWNENQQLTEAVAVYLDDHPEAIDQAAIEAMFGDQLDEIEGDLSGLKSALTQLSTNVVLLENGTYSDSDGIQKVSNNARIRNINPIAINGIRNIVIPEGYEAWIFELGVNLNLLDHTTSWLTGVVNVSDIKVAGTQFITFAIRNISTPSSDISGEVGTVQNNLQIITENESNFEKIDSEISNGGYEYRDGLVRGTYNSSGVLSESTTRIRPSELIEVSSGDVLEIDPGNLKKAYAVWKGSASLANLVISTSFTNGAESITITDAGYFIVAFAKANDSTITPSDFTGSIKIYNSLPYKNKVALDNLTNKYELPDYYMTDNYIENKVNRINTLGKSADDVFIFITDIHWELNARKSPALINYLMQNCNISKVFDGGDLSDTAVKAAIDAYRDATIGEIHHATGNHDWFPPETGKSLYYALDYDKNNQIGAFDKHYWFVDNVQAKIRYVVLNGFKHTGNDVDTGWEYGFDSDQVAWFVNEALDAPDGYDVIIITHYFGTNTSEQPGGDEIDAAINAFNSSARNGKVLFIAEGHRHWDAVFTRTGGVPIVLTTCDKYDVSNEPSLEGYVREAGTLTEQAFDVCIVNRDNGTATFVRIGAEAMDNNNVVIGETGFTLDETLEERTISFA